MEFTEKFLSKGCLYSAAESLILFKTFKKITTVSQVLLVSLKNSMIRILYLRRA